MTRQITILSCLSVTLLLGVAQIQVAASLPMSPETALEGDFNFDGFRDGKDVDILTQYADLVAGFKPTNDFEDMLDMDSSGWVDLYDIVEWLRIGTIPSSGSGNGGTIMGDADLDGDVDREDLDILTNSMGNTKEDGSGIGKYTLGDFDGNNHYDLEDMVIWGRGYRVSSGR